MKSISISIPTYNNVDTIINLVEESKKVLTSLTDDYEIIVIDDGSSDLTLEKLSNLNDEKIRIFNHTSNKGFGQTLIEVFTIPSKELVFFIPGDGQILPKEILKLVPYIDDYDFILGIRINRQDGFIRRIFSNIYNNIISFLSSKKVVDVNSVVLCKRKIFNKIVLNSRSAFIHSEIYLKTLKEGFKIKEVPIEHQKRIFGKSGAMKFKVIFSTCLDLIKYVFGGL